MISFNSPLTLSTNLTTTFFVIFFLTIITIYGHLPTVHSHWVLPYEKQTSTPNSTPTPIYIPCDHHDTILTAPTTNDFGVENNNNKNINNNNDDDGDDDENHNNDDDNNNNINNDDDHLAERKKPPTGNPSPAKKDFKATLLNPAIGAPISASQAEASRATLPGAEQAIAGSRRGKALRARSGDQQLDYEVLSTSNRSNTSQRVCLTPGCVKAAAEILKNMDETVNPCEDFYQYACGNWIESQVIPEDRTSVSLFSVISDELDNKLRNLIEKEPAKSDAPIVSKMRTLYKSCLDVNEIENLGNEPLLNVINAMGGWPVLGDKQPHKRWSKVESNFPTYWLDLMSLLRKYGFSHDILIDLSVTPDFRNNTKHIIDVDQASLGMPDRSYLLKGINDSAVAAYYKLMVESAVMLGASEPEAKKQMMDVLQFETKLAEYSLPREERRNISNLYNKMNYTELQALAPEIDWILYFDSLLVLSNETNTRPYNPDSDEVIVNVPSFIVKVSKLIKTTEPALLTNYVMWRVVLQSISTLGKKWRELAHNYNGAITGQQREEPRWEQCLGSLSGALGIALSSLYVRHHFKTESKKAAEEMVQYIRDEFMKILEEVNWMDQVTKKEARAKAQAISSYIGYPDELLDDKLIEEIYQGLDIGTNYFNNIQSLRRWSTDYSFGMLRKKNEKIDWKKHARAATVNAFYNSLDNSIEFPAGILQGSFYDKSRPNYLNFGSIGFIIGHEITHGFDDKGRQFDKDGNNRNWWDSGTDERFKERAQCIIDQYSQYVVPENGIKVNGVNTQGENIADNGGLKEAFRAYNQWVERNGEEPRLPGLDMSPRQLFWVSSANVWCGKFRPEVLKLRVMVGSHSPSRFRITGPFSNLEEFSQTFNCPPGAPLNPTNKCSVW